MTSSSFKNDYVLYSEDSNLALGKLKKRSGFNDLFLFCFSFRHKLNFINLTVATGLAIKFILTGLGVDIHRPIMSHGDLKFHLFKK